MNNEQYLSYEEKFTAPARMLLQDLRERLVNDGYGPFTLIEQTDHDVDRGLEFHLDGDPTVFVEIRLTDGDEYGFDGVGLVLECSTYMSGQVWAPGNFTEDVGMTNPDEVEVRLIQFPAEDVANCIKAEWARIALSESVTSRALNAPR